MSRSSSPLNLLAILLIVLMTISCGTQHGIHRIERYSAQEGEYAKAEENEDTSAKSEKPEEPQSTEDTQTEDETAETKEEEEESSEEDNGPRKVTFTPFYGMHYGTSKQKKQEDTTDVLYFRNGMIIKTELQSVGNQEIKYTLASDPNKKVHTVHPEKLITINYSKKNRKMQNEIDYFYEDNTAATIAMICAIFSFISVIALFAVPIGVISAFKARNQIHSSSDYNYKSYRRVTKTIRTLFILGLISVIIGGIALLIFLL